MSRILLIEDEINVRHGLSQYLGKEGFQVLEASSIQEAMIKILEHPDIIVLDWMLPDGQGIELLKRWRHQGIEIPTILLTARAELVDRVLGLELGANDYLTKPFEPRELVARIRVQIRQNDRIKRGVEPSSTQLIVSSDLSIHLGTRESFFSGKRIDLTKTEFDLLRMFLENPNQVFSREELLKQVWGYGKCPTTRTVDTHVLQLRQKTRAELFETVHKIGYRFRPEKT